MNRHKLLMSLFDEFIKRKDLPLSVFKGLNGWIVQDYYSKSLTPEALEVGAKLVCSMYRKLMIPQTTR